MIKLLSQDTLPNGTQVTIQGKGLRGVVVGNKQPINIMEAVCHTIRVEEKFDFTKQMGKTNGWSPCTPYEKECNYSFILYDPKEINHGHNHV